MVNDFWLKNKHTISIFHAQVRHLAKHIETQPKKTMLKKTCNTQKHDWIANGDWEFKKNKTRTSPSKDIAQKFDDLHRFFMVDYKDGDKNLFTRHYISSGRNFGEQWYCDFFDNYVDYTYQYFHNIEKKIETTYSSTIFLTRIRIGCL